MDELTATTAIVDYGMGNLFSVAQACRQVGLQAKITALAEDVTRADAVILPGVGAFGAAMQTLHKLGLDEALRFVAQKQTPLMGICLGMQLLFSASEEFGYHAGLGIIEGQVRAFPKTAPDGQPIKVPHVGWSMIHPASETGWSGTFMEAIPEQTYMYFVHSFYTQPKERSVCCSTSRYGGLSFCSGISVGNIFACQFHPERSGPVGLSIYQRFATQIIKEVSGVHP